MDAASIGYVAGFLTTLAFVPQAWQIWRTRSARDISASTFSVFTIGIVLWVIYGVLKAEWPIVLWNAITLGLAVAILVMKFKFEKRG